MKWFWMWTAAIALAWTAVLFDMAAGQFHLAAWLGCALFMAMYFATPLFRSPAGLTALLVAANGTIAAVFWLLPGGQAGAAANPYPLLLASVVFGLAVQRLPRLHTAIVGAACIAAAGLSAVADGRLWSAAFVLVYAALAGMAAAVYMSLRDELAETTATKDALLSEYRRLKRYGASGEETIRQQERARIARDMHDSLGHKLTALLMQVEVLRLQPGDNGAGERLDSVKELAQSSLAETRRAVGALRRQEPGGVQAIIELIRKLEAESFVRVQFSLGEGVLSAPLDAPQSVALYRAIQEALTNAMRHGDDRQVEIGFEATGGRMLRFVVSNGRASGEPYREGFGLSAMRERLLELGGDLHTTIDERRFVLEGRLPLGPLDKGGTTL